MTALERVLTRRASPLVVQLVPADAAHKVPVMVRLRERGRRTWFEIPLPVVYLEAVRRAVAARRRRRVRRGLLSLGGAS